MIKTMTAKYPGKCAHTGAPIYPGDEIQFDTASRKAWLSEPGDFQAEAARPRYQSNFYRTSSGAELYQNKAGRCEDAPCCGCCNF